MEPDCLVVSGDEFGSISDLLKCVAMYAELELPGNCMAEALYRAKLLQSRDYGVRLPMLGYMLLFCNLELDLHGCEAGEWVVAVANEGVSDGFEDWDRWRVVHIVTVANTPGLCHHRDRERGAIQEGISIKQAMNRYTGDDLYQIVRLRPIIEIAHKYVEYLPK